MQTKIKVRWTKGIAGYRSCTNIVAFARNKSYFHKKSSTIPYDARKESSSIFTTTRRYISYNNQTSCTSLTTRLLPMILPEFQPLTKSEIQRDCKEIGKRSAFMVRISSPYNPCISHFSYLIHPSPPPPHPPDTFATNSIFPFIVLHPICITS